MRKGDRYVVLEEISAYGMLYNYHGVKHLNKLLEKTGWRIPTKKDWDDMLNALEPCEYRNHNSEINNRVLGKFAGVLLKSQYDWRTPIHDDTCDRPHHHHDSQDFHYEEKHEVRNHEEEFDVDFKVCNEDCHEHHPHRKPISPQGIDAYGMGMLPGGFAYLSKPIEYNFFGLQGAYWTSDMMHETDVYSKIFDSKESGVVQIGERPSAFLSIRLVKDYDGTNHKGVENILGQNYKTILMPSLNNPSDHAIWTAQNLNFREKHIETVAPNAGLGVEKEKIYFIYEWNGFDWERNEMVEGDSVTVLEGERHNESYRIIDGVLTNVTEYIISAIRNELTDELDIIKARIDVAESTINEHGERLDKIDETLETLTSNTGDHEARVSELEKALAEETEARKAKDTELEERIASEEQKRHNDVDDLYTQVATERESRKKRDEELQASIDTEVTTRGQQTQELYSALATETESRKRRDEELQNAIDNEVAHRGIRDDELQNAIVAEIKARTNRDNELQSFIDAETASRKRRDDELQASIDTEVVSRKKRDEELQASIDTEATTRGQEIQKVYGTIDIETASRKRRDEELQASIDAEAEKRGQDVQSLWTETEILDNAIKIETERAKAEEAILDNRTTILEGKALVGGENGCSYDEKNGVLTLKAVDDVNTITIDFNYNFGEC